MSCLADLLKLDPAGNGEATAVRVQIDQVRPGRTQSNKPYYDLDVVDSQSKARFKIWSDTDAFNYCESARAGDLCELSGHFFVNNYGLNVNQPRLRGLKEKEAEEFLAGSAERREQAEKDWAFVQATCGGMKDKRLKSVALLSLEIYEKRWKRAAAARTYHHARRGGLLDHTSQMLRCAVALAPLYPEVSPDLLYCGVLFHDIGKLWENDYPERGFVSQPNRTGELIGHISIGIEVVNRLWHQASEADPEGFGAAAVPPSDVVRDHLLHLIASHHGSREFGSPVTPRTPEGWLLHHIDNIDAKIEMLRCAYAEKEEVVPGLYDVRRPLEGLSAKPLAWYEEEESA